MVTLQAQMPENKLLLITDPISGRVYLPAGATYNNGGK